MLGSALLITVSSLSALSAQVARSAAKPGGVVRLTAPGDHPKARLQIGGRGLRVQSRTRNEGSTDFKARLPEQAPEGCFVPVHLVESGRVVPGSLPVAISRSGPCRPPYYQLSTSAFKGRTAIAARVHTGEWSLENAASGQTIEVLATFFDADATSLNPGPALRFPPPGLCSSGQGAYAAGTDALDVLLPLLATQVGGRGLEVGSPLFVDDGRYQMTVPLQVGQPWFRRTVSSGQTQVSSMNISGSLRLRVPGGPDTDAFVFNLPFPAPFEWTSRPDSPVVEVRQDVPIGWRAATEGVVLASVATANTEARRYSWCLCVAESRDGVLLLPGKLLSGLVEAAFPRGSEAAARMYLVHIPSTVQRFSQGQVRSIGLSLQVHTAPVLLRR